MDNLLYKAGRTWADDEGAPPRVSVLVPIYNAERWLDNCLNTLLSQTLHEIEIVCINDGSTDSSASIIANYAACDGRITTVTKPNTGYGDSMNLGISVARGSYLGIVEPDDWVDPHMFAHLLRTAEVFDCDMVKGNYYEVEGEGDAKREHFVVIYGEHDYWQPFDPHDNPRILLVRPATTTGLYRTSWLREAGIAYTPSPGAAYQDVSFNHQCMICARRMKLVRQGHYRYRIDNEASSVNTGGKAFAVCDEFAHTFDFLSERPEDLATFGPILNAMRFAQYVWNYNHIEDEQKLPFAQRWSQEMKLVREAGLLAEEVLPQAYRTYLGELVADPRAFCERLPDQIEYLGFV